MGEWRAVDPGNFGAVRSALRPVGIDSLLIWRELGSPASQIWAYHSRGDDSLQAVLVRQAHRWLVWHRGALDWEAAARQLCMDRAGFCIEGPSGSAGALQRALGDGWNRYDEEAVIFVLRHAEHLVPPRSSIRRCHGGDDEALGRLFGSEGATWRNVEEIRDILSERRIFACWEGGEAVSTALTLAEAPGAAFVGGVFTKPAHRGTGLAGECVSALGLELLGEGKTPWLICSDSAAERIYRALGFVSEGLWIRSYYSGQ